MVFSFSAAAMAAVTLSGTLSYHFEADKNKNDGKLKNDSVVDFFRISVATNKSFDDDRANAYLNLQCQTALTERDTSADNMLNWNIYQYGYTYNMTDRLMLGMYYDAEGVTLSDGILASDWQWVRTSAFNSKNVIKLVVSPFDTVTAGIYYEPVLGKYVVKGQFKITGLKIGAGYTNSKDFNQATETLYNVYTEFLPSATSRIYMDYYSNNTQMLDAKIKFDPITLALLYSNTKKTYLNLDKYTIFDADTADFSVDYAFTERKSITGGMIWSTKYEDLDGAYIKYNVDRGYIEIKQASTVDQSEALADTHIMAGYRVDGTNLWELDYNTTTSSWWTRLVIYL
jgi:hypothetical protein